MNANHYLAANLRHHWRSHLAVAMAVAVATAVLTGALLVGDSVRGSLRDLTLYRLGRIEQAVAAPHFFRAELADELAGAPDFHQHFAESLPVLLLQGSASARSAATPSVPDSSPPIVRQSNDISLIGVTEDFWKLGHSDPRGEKILGSPQGVWLTQEVAHDLAIGPGDELLVRLPLASAIPADSPLGEKDDRLTSQRFTVAGLLPSNSLARFRLLPSAQPPRAIFFPLEQLALAMEQPGKANTLLLATDQIDSPLSPAASSAASNWLATNFRPSLADYGLRCEALNREELNREELNHEELNHEELVSNSIQISSQGLVLPPVVVEAAQRAFGPEQLQPITTYLANSIRLEDRTVAYSTLTGVDSVDVFGPLLDGQGKPILLAENQVVLNRWAAKRLNAKQGDTLTLRFYEPESTHGVPRERTPPLKLQLAAITELQNANGQPTLAADPKLTPQLDGVTDQKSIADWDLPFELVEPITPEDETYWDEYSTTPKAFVSHSLAQRLWATRWGAVSLLRVLPTADHTTNLSAEEVASTLLKQLSPADMGWVFQPVKQQGLDASSGSTPFNLLFMGFSMFLIAAALMLLVLLFRLAMEERASELGLLSALGFDVRLTRQLLGRESLVVAAVGASVGLLLGVAYAATMVALLRTLWVAAVASPFLQLHIGLWSLPLGFLLGWGAAWLTTRRTLGQVLSHPARGLLAGVMEEPALPASPAKSPATSSQPVRFQLVQFVRARMSELCLLGALLLGGWGTTLSGEAQAGTFFGVGALLLTSLLGWTNRYWRSRSAGRIAASAYSLPQLALANLARHPGRSTLTIALVASASFLLLAISAFHLAPSSEGTGGTTWFATSDLPLHYDLGSEQGQIELGFSDSDLDTLAHCTIDSFRVHAGENASCLNLYKTAQPRILGTRDPQRVLGNFAWATGTPALDSDIDNSINSNLGTDSAGRPVVPVVLDFATAVYSLHLSGKVGDQLTVHDGAGRDVTMQVVGLLKNSLLQGDLIISDSHFRQLFPSDSGSQVFFITDNRLADPPPPSPADRLPTVDHLLENQLADYGFAATSSQARLARFLAVQNTYLSTFQSLGGLGLLLGTVGLAVVQLRGVIERRGELALLQAVGFRPRRVLLLVLLESGALLAGGLLLGALAAALSLLPQLLPSGQQPARFPWATAASLLAIILAVGLTATWLSTRRALHQSIIPALRGE